MSENNNRPYKCADPLSTINRVRQALERCGLFTIEKGFYHPSANVACSRVMLGDEELLSFGVGTNGKGMNMRYALASAYGEFLERLQNGMLFPNRQLQFSPNGLFRFGPDEILCTPEETVAECGDIVREIFNLSTDADALNLLKQAFGDKRVLCAPFADITGGCVRNVPIKLFYNTSGTNGMCAGNTPLEAIVHGISEIAERFAMREIYMERITPPIVPPECFEGTVIHDRLEAMRPLGYRYEIRDCSLGIGLPVIGLLLFNEKGEHTFHLGADPRAHVALERCLTEIFQGSEEDILAAVEQYPDTPMLLLIAAEYMVMHGNGEQALSLLEQLENAGENGELNSGALFLKMLAMAELERIDEAAEIFRKLLEDSQFNLSILKEYFSFCTSAKREKDLAAMADMLENSQDAKLKQYAVFFRAASL